jgi:hypothetical protein
MGGVIGLMGIPKVTTHVTLEAVSEHDRAAPNCENPVANLGPL